MGIRAQKKLSQHMKHVRGVSINLELEMLVQAVRKVFNGLPEKVPINPTKVFGGVQGIGRKHTRASNSPTNATLAHEVRG